jgi:predicted metal-binding membrane protein
VALIGALAVASWAALAAWSAGPYARYLAHDGWLASSAVGALCAAVPWGAVLVPASLHALAWVLMIAAMMVPTTLPLVATFARVVSGRGDAGTLIARVAGGYLAAWAVFGLAAHAADEALRAFAAHWPWFALHAWVVGAGVLAGAGLFQFSDAKYRCLDACRSTFGFVASRWSGRAPGREAFRIGIDHGIFCVGCCWALMLVMFVVGSASVAWMLAIAAAMAAEKNLPFGPRLRAPLGCTLLASAGLLVAAAL